jgi:hypothetical protein
LYTTAGEHCRCRTEVITATLLRSQHIQYPVLHCVLLC